MNTLIASRAVIAETARQGGGAEGGTARPFASGLELMAARSEAIAPRLERMIGVLLDAAHPSHCGGRAVLRPLWVEEAMHRAGNMLHLVAQLPRRCGVGLDDDCALRLDGRIADDLAALLRTLDIGQDEEELPCSAVLRGVVRNLVGLFGSGAGGIVIRTDIERLSLPAYRRRALVLAASELVTNALRHGFADRRGGQIEVTLRTIGTARARLAVVDDGVGWRDDRPPGRHGIAGALADLLEAELVYHRFGIAGTYASVAFPIYERKRARGAERSRMVGLRRPRGERFTA